VTLDPLVELWWCLCLFLPPPLWVAVTQEPAEAPSRGASARIVSEVVFAIDMPVRFLAAGRPAVYFGAGAGRTSLGRRWWVHLGLWVAEFQKNASHVASDVKKGPQPS
jgi:hypothetical protein